MVAGIDVAALNRIKLDEGNPTTLPVDDLLLARRPLPFQGRGGPPPPPVGELHDEDDPLNQTAMVAPEDAVNVTLPFDVPAISAPAGSEWGATAADEPPSSTTTPQPTVEPAVVAGSDRAAAEGRALQGVESATDEPSALASQHSAPQPAAASGGVVDTALAQLTLEQYAAFCAERTVFADRLADVMARYHVPDETQASLLDQLWRARRANDDELDRRYTSTYEHYCRWLREQSGR